MHHFQPQPLQQKSAAYDTVAAVLPHLQCGVLHGVVTP